MNPFEFLAKEFHGGILNSKPPYFMIDAINDISGCLSRCMEKAYLDAVDSFMQDKSFKNIFLIGCGTSLNSGKLAAYAIRELTGIPAYAMNAFDFITDGAIEFSKESLVICASHSGTTVPTCFAKEKAMETGVTVIAVVGSEDTRLAKGADFIMVDPYGEENVFGKTRSYLSAAFLEMLPAIMGLSSSAKAHALDSARQMISALKENIKTWDEQAAAIAACWAPQTNRYLVIGMGVHSAVADEIALKFIEVVTEPANGFGLEESVHGPSAAFCPNTGIILFQADDRVLWRAKNIDGAINVTASKEAVITTQPDAGWTERASIIAIPALDPIWAAYCSTVVGQLIVYYLGVEKGYCTDVNGQDRNPCTIDCRPFLKFNPSQRKT